jgi:hypothetical protein
VKSKEQENCVLEGRERPEQEIWKTQMRISREKHDGMMKVWFFCSGVGDERRG